MEGYAQAAALGGLVVGCFLVLRPFITGILFAAVIASSTWPLFVRLRRAVGGRATVAASLMSLALVVLIVGPLALLATSLAGSVGDLAEWIQARVVAGPVELPGWVRSLPAIARRCSPSPAACSSRRATSWSPPAACSARGCCR
jgi:predicted PurR-regulated permease PerM